MSLQSGLSCLLTLCIHQAVVYGTLTSIAIFFVKERIPVVTSRQSRQKRAAKIDWSFLRTRNFISFTSMIALTSWGSFLPPLYIPSFGKVRTLESSDRIGSQRS